MEEKRKRILVVDDSAMNRTLLKSEIEGKGYEVLLAEDGEEGLKKVILESPDLLLMDVVMPEMDGWETCRKVKEAAEGKNIPIIIMTSKDKPQDMLRSFEEGADEFINKPINFDELFETVSRLLKPKPLEPQTKNTTRPGAP